MGERVAVILAGGGARGAYEAGALSVLLPELERRGQRPVIAVGTSVGALNAAFVAATAHLPAAAFAERALAVWAGVDYDQVLAPLASPGSAARLLAYVGEALGVPRAHVWSVLDPRPLRATLAERIDFAQVGVNVASGVLHAAAVAGTAARTGRTAVFHQGGGAVASDERRGIDYLPVDLGVEHVLASSAIPALFPAVAIDGAWYADGGTRLNTPIKPALELGADRVVVVALNATARADFGPGRPDALVGAGSVLQAVLADQLLHDVRTLATINALVQAAGADELAGRRRVPYALVAPARADTVGRIAREVFAEHYSDPLDSLRNRDLAAIGRAVAGGTDAAHGELLSYLFFAPEFTRALLDLGRRDAERRIADGLWAVS